MGACRELLVLVLSHGVVLNLVDLVAAGVWLGDFLVGRVDV